MGSSQRNARTDTRTGASQRSGARANRARLQTNRGAQSGAGPAGERRSAISGRIGEAGAEENRGGKIIVRRVCQTPSSKRRLTETAYKIRRWTFGACRATAFAEAGRTLDVCFMPQVQVQDDRLIAIRAAFPKEGLFAEKEWLLSPDAFPIGKKFLADLEQLGHRLFVFQRACNQLYHLRDAGKPRGVIECARRKESGDGGPRGMRRDLMLTGKGYIIAEIDSVPGGIG